MTIPLLRPRLQSWPEHVNAFMELFARFEAALPQIGLLQDRRYAQANWHDLAARLGDHFFQMVSASGHAATLIGEPPRKLMTEGLQWMPEHPQPITNAAALLDAVCQVRHNLAHAGKHLVPGADRERDHELVRQALWVLEQIHEQYQPLQQHLG